MDVIRRGVVVVHGVGEQGKADWLDTLVEPLVAFLGRALGYKNVQLVARLHRENGPTSSATLYLTPPDGPSEEWHIREAWWARSFKPSDTPTAVAWAFGAFFFQFMSTFQNILWRNLLRGLSRVLPALRRVEAENEGKGVWQVPVSGAISHFLDFVNWVVITLGYLLVFVVGLVLLVPVYVVLLFPLEKVWPDAIGNVRRAGLNFITGNIGDQHAMTNRRVAVAAAANVVCTALQPFLDPDDLKKRNVQYDTVTVIAHSGGCVVSFEALAGTEVRKWLGDPPTRRITWLTVGSGLNLAWRMRADQHASDDAFWRRRIDDHVNWINIYARYDPVPQGQAPNGRRLLDRGDMVGELAGPEHPRRPYVNVRVANDDWPFSDHGGYWTNREEVMARIVYAISDARFKGQGLDWLQGETGSDRLGVIVKCAAVHDGPEHRRRVTQIQTVRLSLGAVLLGILLPPACQGVVAGLGERLPGSVQTWIDERVPKSVLGIAIEGGRRAWLGGAAVLLLGVVIAFLLWRLVFYWWQWRRPERDDEIPCREEESPAV